MQMSTANKWFKLLPCKFTHHMNPFFLSCQFPKLVRANVDERLQMPMVSTSVEGELTVINKPSVKQQ